MVYPTGVEPATLGVGVLRSIQLSYEYIFIFFAYYSKKIKKRKGFLHTLQKISVR